MMKAAMLRSRFQLFKRAPSFLRSLSTKAERSVYINFEKTPNAQSMKLLLDVEVLPERFGTGIFIMGEPANAEERRLLKRSPLAKVIFDLGGFKSIFLGRDFITITKNEDQNWKHQRHFLLPVLMDFFSNPDCVVLENSSESEVTDTTILETDSEVVATIKELMESRIRPSVQEDGGDIFYAGFDEEKGLVKVRLAGSCVGCPSSSVTLRQGVEKMLMHYIPEVKGIEEVFSTDDGTSCKDSAAADSEVKLSFKPEFVQEAPPAST